MNPSHGCERVRGRLDRYVDGTLTSLERALDEGHLEACGACRAELGSWQALLGSLTAAMQPAADEFEQASRGLARRFESVPTPAFRWRHLPGRVLVPLTTAVAAVLLLLALQWTGVGVDSMTSVPMTELVPDLELRLPAWSNVIDGVWTREEAR